MKDTEKDELRKIEDFIDGLYKSGKNSEDVREKLIDWFSENTLSKKITEFLKEASRENNWKFKQIKFADKSMLSQLEEEV